MLVSTLRKHHRCIEFNPADGMGALVSRYGTYPFTVSHAVRHVKGREFGMAENSDWKQVVARCVDGGTFHVEFNDVDITYGWQTFVVLTNGKRKCTILITVGYPDQDMDSVDGFDE